MAQPNQKPTQDVQAGLAALEEDLPRVLRALEAPSIEALGWSQPNKLTLLIPMSGSVGEQVDHFVLKLGFQAYRAWPPSALFVNPSTSVYSPPVDKQHVPRLESNECRTHVEYDASHGHYQVICCSATLEFYEVLHSVEPQHVWKETNTFLTTLTAIRRAFASHYKGRFPAHG